MGLDVPMTKTAETKPPQGLSFCCDFDFMQSKSVRFSLKKGADHVSWMVKVLFHNVYLLLMFEDLALDASPHKICTSLSQYLPETQPQHEKWK